MPTNWQGSRTNACNMMKNSDSKFSKIKQNLTSNFYYILSLPPCQVKEHKPQTPKTAASIYERVKMVKPCVHNCIKIWNQWNLSQPSKYVNMSLITTILNCSWASSGEQSHPWQPTAMPSQEIGTSMDPSRCTGRPSHKQFIIPSGEILPASEIAKYPFNAHDPAKE